MIKKIKARRLAAQTAENARKMAAIDALCIHMIQNKITL